MADSKSTGSKIDQLTNVKSFDEMIKVLQVILKDMNLRIENLANKVGDLSLLVDEGEAAINMQKEQWRNECVDELRSEIRQGAPSKKK